MKTKKKKQESSSESSDSSDDSSASDDKKISKKYVNETDVGKSKKSKKRKRKSSSSSSSSESSSSSSDSDSSDQKKKKSKKSTKKSHDDETSKERRPIDGRLKTSRHDLEASKWDSPSDKIMDGQKNRDRRRSPDRPSHTREWDRGKPHDNRPRKYDDRRPPYDRNRHDFDRNRDYRNDRRYDDRDRRNRDFDNKNRKRDDDWNRNDRNRSGRSPDRRNFRNGRRNRSKSPKEENYEWGKESKASDKKPIDKEKPNFSLSGKLAEDVMTYKGVVIKYSEPPEARKPKRRWRLYPFKGEKAMQTLYIHRESAYLLGRERKVVDLPLDHPSCSKQHAALQYRLVPFEREDGSIGKRVRPYIIDLDSANGTFVNNVKIEPKKYVELLEKDVLKFGYSTREYVLLHENSKDEDQDDDVQGDDEEVVDVKPKIKIERLEPMQPILPQEAMIG